MCNNSRWEWYTYYLPCSVQNRNHFIIIIIIQRNSYSFDVLDEAVYRYYFKIFTTISESF